MNQIFGSVIALYTASSVVGFAMTLDIILIHPEVDVQAVMGVFQVMTLISLVLAADVNGQVTKFHFWRTLIDLDIINFFFCFKMETLKKWLSIDENRKSVPDNELNIILHEIQWNTIAIRGGRAFTYTYTLLWNVIQENT